MQVKGGQGVGNDSGIIPESQAVRDWAAAETSNECNELGIGSQRNASPNDG